MNRLPAFGPSIGIRKTFFLLLMAVFVPLFLLQGFTFYQWYEDRKTVEMQANLEVARSVAGTFRSFVEDVLRTELAVGAAATASPRLSRDSLRGILKDARWENPALRDLSWVSPGGVILASSNPEIEKRNLRSSEFFKRAVSGEKWVLSDQFISGLTGKPTFVIYRPIYDVHGRLRGVVAAAVVPDSLGGLLAITRSKDAGVSLIDSKGTHVYRYPFAMMYTPAPQNFLKLYPQMEGALKGREVKVTVASGKDGKKRLVAFVPVPLFGWVAAASRSEAEVVAGIWETMLPQAILILVLAAGAFVTAIAFSSHITAATLKLRNHAIALGRGENDEIQLGSGPEELRYVAEAFSQMAEKVRMREEALTRSEARLRRFFDAGIVGVVYWSQDGTITDANDRFLDMVGYSRKDLNARRLNWDAMTPPEYRHLDVRSLGELKEKGVCTAYEKEYIRKNGSRIPIILGAALLSDSADEGVAFVLDIAERKRAEEQLRRSEEKFAKAFAMNPAAIGLTHLDDGFIIDVNETWLHMFGYTRDEVVGHSTLELSIWQTPEDRVRWANTVGEKGSFRGEQRLQNKSGERFVTLASAELLIIGGEEMVVSTWLDITGRKRLEEELRRSHDELELRVERRTNELRRAYDTLLEQTKERQKLEDRLRQAEKMEAVGTLAGGIAHDFNNMLAVIIGNAELALDDLEENAPPARNVRQIVKASKRATDLVKQILAFSRKTESGRSALRLTPLVEETFKLLRGTLPTTIRMDLNIRTDRDSVFADPSQMQQVVMNLATNAAHAMQDGGGVLTVDLTDVDIEKDMLPDEDMQPGPYVKLTVRDTGTGIGKEILDRIFEPFFTTKEAGQGTGMGLAVAYGIVKSHTGAITVETAPGAGSAFNVFLPYRSAEVTEERGEGRDIPRGSERILLVDDEPEIVRATAGTLERLGYRVTGVESGTAAWEVFEKGHEAFDLVITDQTMPDLTGIELAKRILKVRENVPIILFTGYSESVSPETAREAGIREFVMKPIAKQDVARTVRRVLDAKEKPE